MIENLTHALNTHKITSKCAFKSAQNYYLPQQFLFADYYMYYVKKEY